MKRRLAFAMVLLLCAAAFPALAEVEIPLGPLFEGKFDFDYVHAISERDYAYMQQYGPSYCLWPHAARADISRMVEGIGFMPEDVLYCRVPAADDLSDDAVIEKAWTALKATYPQAEAAREWYEEACAPMFGTKDGETLAWYAVFLPSYVFASNLRNTTPQPEMMYIVQLDRAGTVVEIVAREVKGLIHREFYMDESMSPLDVFMIYIHNMLWSRGADLTVEEYVGYNILHMFPHMTAGSELTRYPAIRDLPGAEHLPREEAVAIARQHIMQRDGLTQAQVDAFRVETGFLVGDLSNGETWLAKASPVWYILFWNERDEVAGDVYVSGTTGEVVEIE